MSIQEQVHGVRMRHIIGMNVQIQIARQKIMIRGKIVTGNISQRPVRIQVFANSVGYKKGRSPVLLTVEKK